MFCVLQRMDLRLRKVTLHTQYGTKSYKGVCVGVGVRTLLGACGAVQCQQRVLLEEQAWE